MKLTVLVGVAPCAIRVYSPEVRAVEGALMMICNAVPLGTSTVSVVELLLNFSKPEMIVTAKHATRATVIFGELRILAQMGKMERIVNTGKDRRRRKTLFDIHIVMQ